MFNNIQNIQINGEHYSVEEALKLCDEKTNSSNVEIWEKEIFKFIQDWFTSSNVITVTTSGSTGTPKRINLKKQHMIASAKATLSFFNLKKGDSAWLCLPVKYIAGKMMIVRSIVGNLNLLYSEPSSKPIIENSQKIAFTAMVPNQVFELLKTQTGVNQLSRIRNLLIGGSGISHELESQITKIQSLASWHSYGMTETITHIAIRKLSAEAQQNNYFPLPGIKVSTNANRQLVINAPAIGVNNLLTNDIANLMSNGSFIISGRSDNVIISGGVKLHPEIIENKLKQYISENFFVGAVPDKKLGNKIILFIEENLTKAHDANLLKENLKHCLSKFEMPKEIVYLKIFIKTDTGKLKRNAMINKYVKD